MINPKYDLNNYIRRIAFPVVSDNYKINQLFRSSLLRVKWSYNPLSKQSGNFTGILRVHINTPFGKLRPKDYQCQIDKSKDTYIQFISLNPIPDFDYEIEVIHPSDVTRSIIEIWEYIPLILPSSMSSFDSPISVTLDTEGIINAINRNNDDLSTITLTEAQLPVITIASAGVANSNTGLIAPANQLTSELLFNNPGTGSIKLFAEPPPLGILYGSLTKYTAELVGRNSRATLSSPTCKGVIYAVASQNNSMINITRTTEVLAS